ncbi:hypothetical protein ES707_14270 [subsurface metagenome]
MLLRRIFEEGLVEIEIAFSNFEMTKKRADIWYKYCKDLTDEDWKEKIKNCIKGCRKIPTLADILDWKNYYVNGKELAELELRQTEKQWQDKKEKRDDYKYKPIPIKIKNLIHKVLNIPDRDKLNKLKEK